MTPEDDKELAEIRERVMDTLILVPGHLISQEANDRAVLLDWVDDLIQVNVGLKNKVSTLQSVLDQYKAQIAGALKEMEPEPFVACEEDFMAGTICSLRKGHRGEHGTTCHWCGFDWYSEGHDEKCRYYQEDEFRGGGGPGEDGFE